MSKKHKKHGMQSGYQPQPAQGGLTHEADYRIIRFDLVKVLVLNLVYLGVILGLYFANRQSGVLDRWFARLLHF